MSTNIKQEDFNQRSYFWFSVSVGVFVGLVFGFAISSIVSTVRLHEARSHIDTRAATDMMKSQVERGRFGKAPRFTDLIDQNGAKVASTRFKGKVQIVSFIAPYGVHSSPVLVSHLMNLYQELKQSGLLGSKVVFVSYNLDPTHAGPPEMSRFMQAIAGLGPADASNWAFLTGSESSIGAVVAGRYAVQYRPLDAAAYRAYARRMQQRGQYDYAEAVNPLTQNAPPHPHIVDHDELVLVAPDGDIRVKIKQASAYPDDRILQDIAAMLKLPGMGKPG
ncbi:SCO family protein [Acidihalobacter prosperus]|uniref:Thioredoxin domain-containing protein n=1 Tax=Acidihalobacter prosperus TaxID=160660 RepID=A0A1A6C3V5_9GAMM|nr:SCO family protein [Acidihalobacter prosperus]OBS09225.1 hypothetical protein Thpro_021553 [Acidihalobacter prosperus]